MRSRHSSFASVLDNSDTVLTQLFTQEIDLVHSKELILLPETQGHYRQDCNGLILLVGAGRFERPTPCAQGRCATRLRYAPTLSGFLFNQIGVHAIQSQLKRRMCLRMKGHHCQS